MPSEPGTFGLGSLIRRNLRHYWRTNLAVALGCAIAVAALVGSLLVGDSVRGSLRDMALERLGRVEYAISSPSFFREQLAADLMSQLRAKELSHAKDSRNEAQEAQGDGKTALHYPLAPLRGNASIADFAVPAILTVGAAKPANASGGQAEGGAVIAHVNVIGVPPEFSKISSEPFDPPQDRRIVVNSTLAADLGVSQGDAILLTIGRQSAAPADSIFAYKNRAGTTRTLRLVAGSIIPSHGAGAFNLRQESSPPRNLYVALDWLQAQLKQEGKANTILIGRKAARGPKDESAALAQALSIAAKLDDYGLRLRPNPEFGYFTLQSCQVELPPAAVAQAESTAIELGFTCEESSVYLADSIAPYHAGPRIKEIPYSVIAGLDPRATPAGPLPMVGGGEPPALGRYDILLNEWAAKELGARVGDRIELVYPQAINWSGVEFYTLRGIVAMEGPALDRGLVPQFEGITDATTLVDWNPPFPMNLKRIRPEDEAYWKKYGLAPKAFLAPDAVRWLWGRGAGGVTTLALIPPKGMPLEEASRRFRDTFLKESAGNLGLGIQPVRAQALAAAKGTTDFGVIFLSMSFFLFAAAAGMVGLLLRLAVARRASEFGIMTATGFPERTAARVLIGEGFLLGGAGVLIGVPAGVGYAGLILYGLRTSWSGAIGGLSLTLHVTPLSMVIGAAAGFLVSALAVLWAARMLRRTPTLALLSGWRAMAAQPREGDRWRAIGLGLFALLIAGLLLLPGTRKALTDEGAFMACGALMLVGLLSLICAMFRQGERRATEKVSVWRLAWRAASRDWLRSLLTAGLIACASFIIVVVAANRKDLSRVNTEFIHSGAGGFRLMATSDVPIMSNLNTMEGCEALGIPRDVAERLRVAHFSPFRMTSGDDASCLNVQRPAQPRILGVPNDMIWKNSFTFTAPAETTVSMSPWMLLEPIRTRISNEDPIPAFADATTAEWVLHVKLGDEVTVTNDAGKPVRLKIAGLLKDSIFAGELLIGEDQFKAHFGAGGYRFFLIQTSSEMASWVAKALRENLGELGFDVQRTADVLAGYARVQNTYLATFQTLGGLGLLLGVFGVVTVLLRSVVERRSELAMLLALGLRRRQVVAMIVIEHGVLLLLGLAAGAGAALVAVAPHIVSAHAGVNWLSLGGMLAGCLLAGFLSCAFAAAASVRGALLPSLRCQ